MILVEIGPNAGVWLTLEESKLYRKIKFNDGLQADNLTPAQMELARSMINKAVLQRKKNDGKLYYVISSHVSN